MCICYPFYRKSGRDSAFISRFPTALPCTVVCDDACPQKELMLRTLVNKCMNGFVPEVRTRDNWGVPLERFGFSREGEFFVSAWDKLKLPHDCEK